MGAAASAVFAAKGEAVTQRHARLDLVRRLYACASPSTLGSCATTASARTCGTCCASSRGRTRDRLRRAVPRGRLRRGRRAGAAVPRRSSRRAGAYSIAEQFALPIDLRRERRDAVPRPALRAAAADAVPVGRDHSRLHPPALSAVPAEPAGLRLRAGADVDRDAPRGPRASPSRKRRSATSCATSTCRNRAST